MEIIYSDLETAKLIFQNLLDEEEVYLFGIA